MLKKKSKFLYFILVLLVLIIVLTIIGVKLQWFKYTNKNTENLYANNTSEQITTLATTNVTTSTTLPTTTTTSKPIPKDTDYVKIIDYIPTIYVELKYATPDNITGQPIYNFTDAYLRYGTVKKLIPIQNELIDQGLSMKIWDAYRPVEAQRKLWEAMPNPKYIANPNNGYTSHSLGNTIDVTLVTVDGNKIDMPTGFDDFTALADRNYKDVTSTQAKNALLLENIMKSNDFRPYYGEWWHYSDKVKYTYDENFKIQ